MFTLYTRATEWSSAGAYYNSQVAVEGEEHGVIISWLAFVNAAHLFSEVFQAALLLVLFPNSQADLIFT